MIPLRELNVGRERVVGFAERERPSFNSLREPLGVDGVSLREIVTQTPQDLHVRGPLLKLES